MNVCVTGGAGYIGSHASQALLNKGHSVVIVDNLYRGHMKAIDRLRDSLDAEKAGRLTFCKADMGDRAAMVEIFKKHNIEAVMHFAALCYVGESVTDPLAYHANNTGAAVELLRAVSDAGIKRFVFSSTCATYGEPDEVPIRETEKQSPINPYGWSKLHLERALIDQANACAINKQPFGFAALRYFNVAGSDRTGVLGEWHQPETHLIPIVLEVAQGKRDHVTVYGTDYETADGTCVRDYIHVEDLADAHATVIEALEPGDQRFYNLGVGKGYSVKQIIDAAERVTGKSLKVVEGERRAGDPPQLFADPSRIRNELGWSAQITDLDEIIGSAWRWFEANPKGYDA